MKKIAAFLIVPILTACVSDVVEPERAGNKIPDLRTVPPLSEAMAQRYDEGKTFDENRGDLEQLRQDMISRNALLRARIEQEKK